MLQITGNHVNNEYSIISLFVSCNAYNRTKTCPTCRSEWCDHNVYINANEVIQDVNEIVVEENDIVEGNIAII